MSWIEQKYINAMSPRLSRFVKKGDGVWNMRCPICGDSQRNRTKARGFILQKGDRYTYVCHNCNVSMSFSRFLETIDPQLHTEYRREAFLEDKGLTPRRTDHIKQPQPDISKFIQPKFVKYTALNTLKKVSQLDPTHPVKKYVMSRLIPAKYHSKLFFAPKFRAFTNSLQPDKFDLSKGDEPRLIIPLVDKQNNLFGYQGRAFGKTELRYITIILDDEKPRVYGAEGLNFRERVYVVEGPLDSMFLHNCIAMVGSHLDKTVVDLGLKLDNMTVVYDNEPRNKEIVSQIDKAIDKGFNVCVWPENIVYKDINDMVRAGSSPEQVQKTIDQNTYSGLLAKMMLNKWKRV